MLIFKNNRGKEKISIFYDFYCKTYDCELIKKNGLTIRKCFNNIFDAKKFINESGYTYEMSDCSDQSELRGVKIC